MYRTAASTRMLGFAATTAIAAVALAGCTTAGAPDASAYASKAEAALAAGKHARAIDNAEAAVLADPRNPAWRATLGAAYLDAGRFASAATSFDDAMALGDTSPRTVLSLALARIGEGRNVEAAELLHDHEQRIAAADVGLALALAGESGRGIHVMSNAIRAGDNNPTIRQNLAYAYALDGRWREARLMAEQDVSRARVNERMEQWAVSAHPQAFEYRVATLLGTPMNVVDGGQPMQLALANTPGVDELGAEALAAASPVEAAPIAEAPFAELPPLAVVPVSELAAQPAIAAAAAIPAADDTFRAAFAAAAPAAVKQDSASFAKAAVPAAAPRQAASTHLVQLGSFSTEDGARRAWGLYVKKYPQLDGRQMVISEAVVKGKRYWRVSAAGFDKAGSSAMCGAVKARGEGCFAWAEGRPLPGAVDTGVRLARR